MTSLRSVVLAGGGSAGDIEPALALADALRRIDPDVRITALGTARGLEARLVPARGYDLRLVPAVPLPRRPTLDLLRLPGRVRGAVRSVRAVLDEVEADVVVGFGGYVALPAYLAARRRRTPIVVNEINQRPGLANRIGARLTAFVALGAESIPLPHGRFVGMPLRTAISGLDRVANRDQARAELGLAADGTCLLVSGGSQGARSLNLAASGASVDLGAAGVQVLHVSGPKNTVEVTAVPGGPPYVVLPYVDRMELAYAAADLALCRAGAMTVAELTAVGLPAAYVPLPHGNGEQRLNALPVVNAGGGLLVDDADLSPAWIRDTLLPVLTDDAALGRMTKAAALAGRRDGDTALAELVREATGR
ncbi:MAG: UDP-N-acetylglucosamine--N-acetylmuramyl-(pentapeptide) pyrophosphoryl-undecaprenol N-acetylglucosamine transferase [Pseudonocardiales bacterium]|nr:MAG: UDP-N-acetylglucosamine--N-acetylmuramyl-(pentapeptide) pyrophosphoryl-undecaprenol N-acetylglucosamine transferase [Pseudonocardiales bacterium]